MKATVLPPRCVVTEDTLRICLKEDWKSHASLTFRGNEKHVANIKKLLVLPTAVPPSRTDCSSEPPPKRRKTNDELNTEERTWVPLKHFVLTLRDKDYIKTGDKQSDKHVNFAQLLLNQ